ncbi:ABC transporter permease [Pelagicoccus sp. SDUM812003]|uniref:ABC transporter permease n=1 Tax=Pelagicoccus sp. SDUM812003 TaxID=3041267 RepID=UPI00280F1B9B|nr:ABC transporter permease [Pelagicoccus sp. SDUM812003]MDQ8203409.1 ABC transporter permease [Pelagicoccus sp. SDUM812003]
MLTDIRITFRQLRKSRAFALVAMLTLAIGIGAVTTIFGVLRSLVLEPVDLPESEQLAQVWSGDRWPLSPADFLDLHEQMESFEHFGVYHPQSYNIGTEKARAILGAPCTSGVLKAFGVPPLKGRWLNEEDNLPGAEPVAVVSYALWVGYFGGSEDLLGSSVRLDGSDVRVVGIMPKNFEFTGPWIRASNCDIWTPMPIDAENAPRDSHWLCGIGRLKQGVTVEMADAEAKGIGQRLSELYPNSNFSKKFLVRSLHFEVTRELKDQSWLLFAAVSLVLIVACSNVASMLLSRGAQRQSEFGVRMALGASKRRLFRLALAESVALAIGGGVLGIVFAYGGIEAMKGVVRMSDARKEALGIDGMLLGFAFLSTVISVALAGLPPVFAALKTSLAAIIRNDSRGSVGSRSRNLMLRLIVIGQVALAFVLVNGAALFSSGYVKLLEENDQLTTDRVLTAKVSLNGELYKENEDRVRMWDRMVERLKAIPGVSFAGITSKLPLEGGSNTNGLVNDEVYDPSQQRLLIERSSVSLDYFDAMGLTLLQGRKLSPQDEMAEDGSLGVVVNRAFVEKAWPDKNPLGELIRANQEGDPWYRATVVGVVEDVRQWSASEEVQPEMYTTPKGHWGRRIYLVVRSSKEAGALAGQVREAIAELDSELALEDVRTMEQVVLDRTAGERVMAEMIGVFMGIALGLAAVGLYGTLSYHILLRTREIGVRRALGALEADISRLVFRQGAVWVGIGLVIGLGAIYALMRVLESLVYGMDGLSIATLSGSAGVIAVAALVACWMPSRKATRLDPLHALRS